MYMQDHAWMLLTSFILHPTLYPTHPPLSKKLMLCNLVATQQLGYRHQLEAISYALESGI